MFKHKKLKMRVEQSITGNKNMTEILTKVTSSMAKIHSRKHGDQGKEFNTEC